MERFEFQFSTAVSEPPTGSQVRLDNADPAQATRLWVRNTTTPGEDVGHLLALVGAGSVVWLQDWDDGSRYCRFRVTGAAVEKTGYVEWPLEFTAAGEALAAQKISLGVAAPAEVTPAPEPVPPGQPYATVDELAQALRIRVTDTNTPGLQACLNAAAQEIDHEIDRREGEPIPAGDALANRVNIARGVEWYKANDAAFGMVGFDEAGALTVPRDAFARHAQALTPLKQQWGLA